jgi:hypothetical protein
MRTPILTVGYLALAVGTLTAADVTLVKYDGEKKAITVKTGAKEATYRLTDQTKVAFVDKNGKAKDATLEAAIKILANPKAAEKMLKLEITTDKDVVKELRLPGSRKSP